MANLINNIDNFLGKIIFNSFSSLRYCIFNSVIYHTNLKKDPESIWSQKNIITKSLAKPHRYKDVFLLTNKFI